MLAEDISSRMDINIVYGYYGQEEFFQLLGENRDSDHVILGEIIKDRKFKTYRLKDIHYQLKQLYEKFGEALFFMPEYWMYQYMDVPEQKRIEEEKKLLLFPEFEMNPISGEEIGELTIYKELYANVIPYFSRWWQLCSLFTEYKSVYLKNSESFLEFRTELMRYTLAFGGNKIYYLDDQSKVLEGVGFGDEKELSWAEFEKFVADKTSHLMIDIPMFLTDKDYRSEFKKKGEYPLSFIDDFSDIK